MGVKDEQVRKPQSSKPSGVGKAQRFNDNQFVQYELDKQQQAECKAWKVSADEIFGAVSALVDDGYKVSIRWDTYSECYGCFIQDSSGATPNAGYILTGRGSTVEKCLKQALYKHHTCLSGEWAGYVERAGRGVIDD